MDEFCTRCNRKNRRFTGGKSRFLQEVDCAKFAADVAAELCGIAVICKSIVLPDQPEAHLFQNVSAARVFQDGIREHRAHPQCPKRVSDCLLFRFGSVAVPLDRAILQMDAQKADLFHRIDLFQMELPDGAFPQHDGKQQPIRLLLPVKIVVNLGGIITVRTKQRHIRINGLVVFPILIEPMVKLPGHFSQFNGHSLLRSILCPYIGLHTAVTDISSFLFP